MVAQPNSTRTATATRGRAARLREPRAPRPAVRLPVPALTVAAGRPGRGRVRGREDRPGAAHAMVDQRDPEEVPTDSQREPRPGPHPGATPVAPQDRHDREWVTPSTGEKDQLDVE